MTRFEGALRQKLGMLYCKGRRGGEYERLNIHNAIHRYIHIIITSHPAGIIEESPVSSQGVHLVPKFVISGCEVAVWKCDVCCHDDCLCKLRVICLARRSQRLGEGCEERERIWIMDCACLLPSMTKRSNQEKRRQQASVRCIRNTSPDIGFTSAYRHTPFSPPKFLSCPRMQVTYPRIPLVF